MTLALFTISLVFLLIMVLSPQSIRKGKVLSVKDGDTIVIEDRRGDCRIVRLNGIDAPEMSQDYGKEARNFLSGLCLNENVSFREISKDRYGRTVALVEKDGKDISEEMLEAGYAWCYYSAGSPSYNQAMKKAQKQKVGLWYEQTPEAPWNYRKRNGK